MSQPNVVPMVEVKAKAAAARPGLPLKLREQSRQQLQQLINGLFECTDDALFELADRSNSDADHHLYFHSMRQIRLKRAEIEKQFIGTVLADYDALVDGRKASVHHAEPQEVDADSITLLHGDDLETSVAVSGIVSKVTSQLSLPIMELTKRLDAICPAVQVTERINPLGPQKLCDAFVAAAEGLDLDIRVRLILLKLFERLVMQNLQPFYAGANALLIGAGILPDLKHRGTAGSTAVRRAERPPESTSRAVASGGGQPGSGGMPAGHGNTDGAPAAGFGATSFGFIQSLLAGLRSEGLVAGETSGPVLPTAQLVDVLSAVQGDAQREVGAVQLDHVPVLPNLHSVIAARAPDVTGLAMSQLRRADDDVVNFIGMLFDYILNDRNLAIPMKALIARLQIPVVKLAIIDKTFFEKSAHPARQLLNELSSVGIGWSSANELRRDHVYDMVESVIARVLNEFNENPEIFAELLDELRAFRHRDEQRNQLIESRVRQTEAGKARTLAAKQAVQQLINQKASGMRLPAAAGRFISETWSRVLIFACLKHGAQSTVWQGLVRTLDELLWSLQPLQTPAEIERRDALQEDLLKELAEGIDLIQLAPAEATQWQQTLREQLEEIASSDRAYLDQGQDRGDPLATRASAPYVELEEIVLATVGELEDPFHGEPPESSFLAAVDALKEGMWIEMDQAGMEALRCKLTAVVKPGARYVFVNRRGMKVLERSRLELARDLQDGRMRILNDTQVFDRALQTVIGNLRQMQSRSNA